VGVIAGLIVHPFADARAVLDGYLRITAAAPDELTCWVVMRKAPPLPFLGAEWHGREILVLAMCHCGDVEAGKKAVAPLKALGKPIADIVGPMPFVAWQAAFDPLLTPGARNYWKSHDFKTLGEKALDTMVAAVSGLPTPECELFVGHLGGAVNRKPAGASAYPHRDVEYILNVH